MRKRSLDNIDKPPAKLAQSSSSRSKRHFTSLASEEYSDDDWDILPMSQWSHGMCLRWLRDEVKWSEEDIQVARDWLEPYPMPGLLMKYDKIEANIGKNITNLSLALADVTLREHSYSPGYYAKHLKRWAECISRPEQHINTIAEYNEMKGSCDSVMVLHYSDIVRGLEEEDKECFALMQQEKLQLLSDAIDDGNSIDASDYDMEVRILPQHLVWPSFFVAKQDHAPNKHVLLRRIQPPVQDLEDKAVSGLCGGTNVLWTGATGIGKSAYGNVVAEQLVRNLMSKESCSSIDVIAWRIDECAYLISKHASGGIRITCRSVRTLDDVASLSHEVRDRRGVMIVEVRENEKHVPCTICPIFCSITTEDVFSQFKEIFKQGRYDRYVLNCYEWWEVRAAANMLYLLGDRRLGDVRKEYVTEAFNRFVKVGGLPRYVFAEESMVRYHISDVENPSIHEDFVKHVNGSSVDKLAGDIEYFLTPMHINPYTWSMRYGVERPKMCFLSPHCGLIITKIASKLGIETIRKSLMWHSEWMVDENMLHASLSADAVIKNSGMSIRRAEWFIDPGHAQVLNTNCQKARTTFASEIPLYTQREYMQDTIVFGSVAVKDRFKSNVLYISVPNVNMVVADCFMVDHSNRRVFLYQASISSGKEHLFKEDNIRKYINEMRLIENRYKLYLVSVRGAHHEGGTGLSFIRSDSSESTAGDLSADLKTIVKTYVVRANYFGDRYVVLPAEGKTEL